MAQDLMVMLYQIRITPVVDNPFKASQTKLLIDFPEQQRTRIRGDITTVKINHNLFLEAQPKLRMTVCSLVPPFLRKALVVLSLICSTVGWSRWLSLFAYPALFIVLLGMSNAFAASDCNTDRCAPPRCEDNILGDGPHLINVPQRVEKFKSIHHFIDNIWIDVHSDPRLRGPLPIVVIGPGAGRIDWANCYPDGIPMSSGVTLNLAQAGFLAIYVGYRIHGVGAPRVGTLKLRDHSTLDARSLLAAAQWGRTCHEKGGQQVAFIGFSMGTWPAYWSVSENKDLSDLQTDLDIRTIVLAGESANYFSKSRTQSLGDWKDWHLIEKLTRTVRNGYRVLEAFGAPDWSHLAQIQYQDLTSGDLGSNLQKIIRRPTIELVGATIFEEANKSLDGCYEFHEKPPICGDRCFHSTLQNFAARRDLKHLENKKFWVTDEYNAAVQEWEALCPAKSELTNPLVRAWYEESPVCSATQKLKTKRALLLLSDHDKYHDPAAREQLGRSLQDRGIKQDKLECPEISKADGFRCGHFDYFKPDLPGCGWDYVTKELKAAFQPEPGSTNPKSDSELPSYKNCPERG